MGSNNVQINVNINECGSSGDNGNGGIGGYPAVVVTNSTQYNVQGHVSYALCSGDDFLMLPFSSAGPFSRGVCLLTEISAKVQISASEVIEAKPYRSTGTSYSQFAVIQVGPKSFEVTRRVSDSDTLIQTENETLSLPVDHDEE